MVNKRIFLGLATFFIVTSSLCGGSETDINGRKRLAQEATECVAANAEGIAAIASAIIKRHSPETPTLEQLSLAEPVVIAQEEKILNEKRERKALLVESLQSGKGLGELQLKESDVDLLKKNCLQPFVRFFIHSMVHYNVEHAANTTFLSKNCSLALAQDLVIEATIAGREDIVKALTLRIKDLEPHQLSKKTSRSLAVADYLGKKIGSMAVFSEAEKLCCQKTVATLEKELSDSRQFKEALNDVQSLQNGESFGREFNLEDLVKKPGE